MKNSFFSCPHTHTHTLRVSCVSTEFFLNMLSTSCLRCCTVWLSHVLSSMYKHVMFAYTAMYEHTSMHVELQIQIILESVHHRHIHVMNLEKRVCIYYILISCYIYTYYNLSYMYTCSPTHKHTLHTTLALHHSWYFRRLKISISLWASFIFYQAIYSGLIILLTRCKYNPIFASFSLSNLNLSHHLILK